LGEEAVVARLPPAWTDAVGDHAADEADVLSYGREAIRIRSRSRDHAFLVLNDAFYPGWEARVDGAPEKIVRTNALVRGIPLQAGEHVVDFVYRPDSFRLGIWASLSSLTILVLLATVAIRSEKALS